MDKHLMEVLWELLASEDATGRPDDRTVVAAEPVRLIRSYLRTHPSPSVGTQKPWHLESSADGTIHLVLTSPAAVAVATALEKGATGRQRLRFVAPLVTALRKLRATGE